MNSRNFKKYSIYTNLKKCYFYQNEIKFLSFIVSTDRICIKEEKIEAIKNDLNLSQYKRYIFSLALQIFIGVLSKVSAR